MSDRPPLSELGEAALSYIEMGFAVIPLVARDKRPATEHGLNDWTDNPQDVIDWWTINPNDNIGIVCGQPSHGLLVIDIDVDEEKERDGYATLREWEHMNGSLPETAVSITGKGGMHYLYRMDATRASIRPSANIELGIDIRCDASYIVAPPSVHPNGNRYEWQDSPEDMPLADADGNVYALVDYIQRTGEVNDLDTKKPNGKFKLPDKITEGKRDETLYKYGCHLRAIGRSNEEISDAIYGANAKRCDPPLDSRTLNKIVRSVCTKAPGMSDEYKSKEQQKSSDDDQPQEIEPWRTPKGAIRHHVLARKMIEDNHACLINGAPAIWNGMKWEMGVDAIERAACRYCDDIKQQTRNEIVRYIVLNSPTLDLATDFDGKPYVQFSNVTKDAETMQDVVPTKEMFITNTLVTPYDPNADNEVAARFIESISAGDPGTIQMMYEVIAACMCSMPVASEAVMMIGRAGGSDGEASNGKSTFIKATKAILGAHNVSSLDLMMLTKPFHRGSIVGKLANMGDDIPNSFLTGDALSTFKQMVTGDDVFADVKGTKGFSFTPTATLIFSMNEIPRLGDTTEGVFRRLAFLPFRRTFKPGTDDFDPAIMSKLVKLDTRMAFARKALEFLPDLAMRGRFIKLDDMAREVQQIKMDNDVVLRWIEDVGITPESITERTTESVFKQFEFWVSNAGESNGWNSNGISKATFVRRVIKAFGNSIKSETRRKDGIAAKHFVSTKPNSNGSNGIATL